MKSYLKSTIVVSTSTLVSRILGLIRDIALASVFGAGIVLDAFVLAFTIPNLFRRLFGEGALSAVFIPVFTETLEKQGKDAAIALANKVITLLVIILGIIVILGVIACVITLNHSVTSDRNQLALNFIILLMPYLLFICVTAILGAILNSLNHFLSPALAPAILNIAWLMGIFFLAPVLGDTQKMWAYGMSIAILLGGIAQIFAQIPALATRKFRIRPAWQFHDPTLQRIFTNIAPVIWGSAVLQINILVDRLIAWWLIPRPGSLTILYMGNRLTQFPLALIGISLATVVFPLFTQYVARNEYQQLRASVLQAVRLTLFLSLPACAGLVILSFPIITLVYQHNQFTSSAAEHTANVLMTYASGIWIYTLLQIISKVFYSLGDTKTPMRVASVCVIGNVALNLLLVPLFQEIGLALATVVNALLNLSILLWLLHRKITLLWQGIWDFLGRAIFSTATMSVLVLLSSSFFSGRFLKVVIPVVIGIISYFVCCAMLKIPEFKQFQLWKKK